MVESLKVTKKVCVATDEHQGRSEDKEGDVKNEEWEH